MLQCNIFLEPSRVPVAIGWLYVALMMAVAEANQPTGTVLGAIVTFVLYGVGPVALLMYLMGPRTRGAPRAARKPSGSGFSPARRWRRNGR
jgi:hypothetical protein